MYKLLLVDDEPRQVKALANIIKQIRPEYDIITAQDGHEALDVINRNHIDMLMTDIRMPNMDGLQLIEKLFEQKHNLRIVILSGYGEFEYAQRAIHFGVNDYLVKPISKADLEVLLVSVEKSINEEREKLEEQENLKKKLDSSLPVYLEHQLNKWVYGNIDEKGLDEISSIFPFKGCGSVIITSIGKFEQLSATHNIQEINQISQHIKYLMKETMKPTGHSISFYSEGVKGMLVTILNTDHPFNLLSYDNAKRLNEFIDSLKNEYGLTVTVGISEKSENIFKDVIKAFKEASEAADRRFYLGTGRVIHFSVPDNSGTLKAINLNALELELSESVRHLDKGLLAKITSRFFCGINENIHIEPYKIKEDLTYMVLNLVKTIRSFMLEDGYNAFVSDVRNRITGCEEFKELWHCINDILGETIDLLNNSGSDKNNVIIQKCKKYIDENYMDDISLESIAQKYYFNPSYFSNLFKSSTGFGFSEYLLKIRIRNAQDFLKNNDDNMSEVATKVGFKDASYFNRMFKREVGVSPNKYRQMSGNDRGVMQ